jgi:hypothetical protein
LYLLLVETLTSKQVPYGGTVAVDTFLHSAGMEKIMTAVVTKVLKGSPKAMEDLRCAMVFWFFSCLDNRTISSYDARKACLKSHPLDGRKMMRTISFSSEVGNHASLLAPLAAWLHKKYGLASDGAVPILDARFERRKRGMEKCAHG